MVHAVVVVTVQEAIFFPKRGESRGKIGFLITNNVFGVYKNVPYNDGSLPVVLTPKTGSNAMRYFGESHTQE